MNMWGNKLVRYLFLEKGLLEDITRFIVHDMESGIVNISRERVPEFWKHLYIYVPDLEGRAPVKIYFL